MLLAGGYHKPQEMRILSLKVLYCRQPRARVSFSCNTCHLFLTDALAHSLMLLWSWASSALWIWKVFFVLRPELLCSRNSDDKRSSINVRDGDHWWRSLPRATRHFDCHKRPCCAILGMESYPEPAGRCAEGEDRNLRYRSERVETCAPKDCGSGSDSSIIRRYVMQQDNSFFHYW